MFERKSLKWPITLAVLMIVLLVGLMIGWVLLNVFNAMSNETSSQMYWLLLSIGSAMFTCVVAGVVMYLVLSIQQINLNRRQSNFIDSVTHELKSPIASLKLYLQTLGRRNIAEDQRQKFYDDMLSDVERLDQLVTRLLDVARLSHEAPKTDFEHTPIRVDELIQKCIPEICRRYNLASENIELKLEPIELSALQVDLDILFRNLIDNACKYAGNQPKVAIEIRLDAETQTMLGSVTDNGPGIPRHLRRRVFNRFFRIGNELERTKPGTGLGLFLVRSIVRRLHGKISIVEPPHHVGTRFELALPYATRPQDIASPWSMHKE